MIRYAFLWIFHFILNITRFFSTLRPRRTPQPLRSQRRKLPSHLAVLLGDYYGEPMRREVTTSVDSELEDSLESVRRLVKWCQVIGIGTLSVYDREGIVKTHWKELQELLLLEDNCTLVSSADSNKETVTSNSKPMVRKSSLLPTPPLSKSGSSISSTPPSSPGRRAAKQVSSTSTQTSGIVTLKCYPYSTIKPTSKQAEAPALRKRRPSTLLAPTVPDSPGPVTIHLISRGLSKPHIASITSQLASQALQGARGLGKFEEYELTVPQLGAMLEDPSLPNGWSRPDLLIIHTPASANLPQKAPLELQGIPPWQIYLTEMTYIPPTRPQSWILRKLWKAPKSFPGAITERSFRVALDEYDGAEMRFGK